MEDSSWFENGELPPVGAKCEFRVGNFWKPCEIKGEAFDYGERVVLVQAGDTAKLVTSKDKLRPIKSDREKAIEAAYKAVNARELSSIEWNAHAERIFNQLYDAGLLRLPEDK
jgi:hypothetical protein